MNGLDKSGSTPLYWSSHGGHTAIVKLLCSVPSMCISAQVKVFQVSECWSMFSCFINESEEEYMHFFGLQNKIGDTALHAAAWKGHLECVKILLEHGASTTIHNNERKRPVDLAGDPKTRALIQLAMRQAIDSTDFRNDYISESETEDDDV